MSCICNPLVNSYKRLVPGYEAPVAICWSSINRSPLIRIPASRGAGTRIEFRSPDPAANPYLVMALCLAAGLDGIENQLEAPEPIGKNMYLLTEEQIADMNIDVLPATLGEACDAFEQDTYIQEVLGEHISKNIWKQREKNGMNIVDMFLTGKRNHIFINTKLQFFNIPTVDGNDWMAYEDE